MSEQDSAFNRMFDQRWFVNVARSAMLAASLIGLPVAGFYLMRLVSKADAITATVEQSAVKLELLEQSVRLTFDQRRREIDALGLRVNDHETRLRSLERVDASFSRPSRP